MALLQTKIKYWSVWRHSNHLPDKPSTRVARRIAGVSNQSIGRTRPVVTLRLLPIVRCHSSATVIHTRLALSAGNFCMGSRVEFAEPCDLIGSKMFRGGENILWGQRYCSKDIYEKCLGATGLDSAWRSYCFTRRI